MAAPPDLIDDAIAEILLRLPPDDPACLACAAVVCKPWLRVLSDPAFPCRYREFHQTPPLLGFFHNRDGPIPRFVPTAAASPFPHQKRLDASSWWIMDCRHGRVLVRLYNVCCIFSYFVWDPISGDMEMVPMPNVPYVDYTLAVLCAVAGCDHVGCHGGPFLVIFLAADYREVHACVYSSETRAWGMPVSVPASSYHRFDNKRGALTSRYNIYYCNVEPRDRIVRYELSSHSLSMIDSPEVYEAHSLLMPNEDGNLDLAGIKDSSLCLWSRMVNPKGFNEWIQRRVIRLDKFLPMDMFCCNQNINQVYVRGFAEEVGFVYLSTNNHVVFTFELKSDRVTKVSELGGYSAIFPFMRFYTLRYGSNPFGCSCMSCCKSSISFLETCL